MDRSNSRRMFSCRKRQRSFVVVPDFDEKPNGKKFDLAELISRMPADYQATEESFGEPVGKEEW